MCGETSTMEDLLLWKVLLSIGIGDEMHPRSCAKRILWTIRVLVHIAILRILVSVAVYLTAPKFHKIAFSYLTLLCISLALWHLFLRKMEPTRQLLFQIYDLRARIPSRSSAFARNAAALLCVTYPVACSVALLMRYMPLDEELKLWRRRFGIEVFANEDLFVKSFYVSYIYVLQFMPLVMTLVICWVECRIAEILAFIQRRLDSVTENEDVEAVSALTESYVRVFDIVQKLRGIFSPLLFLLVSLNFTVLFISLSRYILNRGMEYVRMLQTVTDSSLNVVMIAAQVLCGSAIPDRLSRIKASAGRFTRNGRNFGNRRAELFFLAKKIEKTEVVFMTGCGVFKIEKTLLLNLFGSLLTFGLLIINWKV